MKNFQTGKFFLILEIDFPLRRNYTDSWHRNVWGTRIRLFIVPDDSVFRTCTIYYRVNFQQKNKNGVSMGDTRKEEAEFSLRKKYHKTIFSRFARAINTYRLVEDGDHVAVCIAQGGNGLILAKCFQEIKRHRKIDFEVDFFHSKRRITENLSGLQKRLVFGAKLHSVDDVKNSGCNKLAVADCYEDVIEMILTGVLYRGEISTLMPKEKERDFGGIEVIRPFYLVHKQDLKEWNMEFGMVTGTKEDFSDQQEEVKRLLEEFENINPGIAANIFKSVENVNLKYCDCISYRYGLHSFWKITNSNKNRTLDTVYFGFLFKTGNKTVIIKNRFHKIRAAQ